MTLGDYVYIGGLMLTVVVLSFYLGYQIGRRSR